MRLDVKVDGRDKEIILDWKGAFKIYITGWFVMGIGILILLGFMAILGEFM